MGWGGVRWEQYQQGAELEGKKLHTGTGHLGRNMVGAGRAPLGLGLSPLQPAWPLHTSTGT